MKKFLVIFILLFLLASPLFASLAFADDQMTNQTVPTPTPVEYQLPYPGLLPDSPLYFLKTLRDRVIDFLVSDPLKKSELDLLLADKRLSSGIALLDKRNASLAESTISKGENYLDEAILQARSAKAQGMDTKSITEQIFMSVKKHEQILVDLKSKAPANFKQKFQNLWDRAMQLEKQVNEIRSKQ